LIARGEALEKKVVVEKIGKGGISMGCALAMILSYAKWQSIFWAILHGLCSWVYVIYFWLVGY
jgi:hypothetical protein